MLTRVRSLRWPVIVLLVFAASLLLNCQPSPEALLSGAVVIPTTATLIATTLVETPTATSTSSPTPTATQTPEAAPTPSATPAATQTPTSPSTETPTSAPTATKSPTPTAMQTPWPTPDGVHRQVRVPVLMYHYLSDPPPNADKYRRDLSVSPALFDQHLAYLKAEGYETISFYDLLYYLTQGRPLPEKSVIISFDDGYLDNHQNAFPLLRKYGYSATFFVITEVVGFQGDPFYMTWDQLREMHAAGMDIECHGRTHIDMTQVSYDHLVWQVLGCKEMIEREIGQRPRFVAYPTGRYNDQVAALFASDNYWGGITTVQDSLHDSDHLFEIKRLRVRHTTSVPQLAALLVWQAE